MALYTIVDDGYDVIICHSLKKVVEVLPVSDVFLDSERTIPCIALNLKKGFNGRNKNYARVYVAGNRDWTYKIQKH